MFRYLPVESEGVCPETGPYRAFGLRVLRSGPEGDEELMVLPAVSTDFAFTLRLASLLTKKQLHPLQLLNLLEDLLPL